jgi:hypothetical protein
MQRCEDAKIHFSEHPGYFLSMVAIGEVVGRSLPDCIE